MTESSAIQAPDIVSERLILRSLTPMLLESLLLRRHADDAATLDFLVPGDWPHEDDEYVIRLRQAQLREDPSVLPWLLRAMILREPQRPMIGHIGFHGPPVEGAVELGYTVFAPYRRRGFALEGAEALMRWARMHDVKRFIVSISPNNVASLAMASKLGFVRIGEQMDEVDGLEYVFELRYEAQL
jgi:RimJ/RimL family protein N-acetyltransferase